MRTTSHLYRHVCPATAMYRSFSPNLLRPNLPLRKPSSGPMAMCASPSLRPVAAPVNTPVQPATGPIGNGKSVPSLPGPVNSPVSRDTPAGSGSMPKPQTVYFCNYCGQKGMFRCKRCKTTSYCSVVCQTEDWNAHRHICKPIDPEPGQNEPKEITPSLASVDGAGLLGSKPGDASINQRVYLKDLQKNKLMMGTDVQASVMDFYSPGRFFVLAQSIEVLEALRIISRELQKTYSCPSATTYAPCVGEVCAVQFSCDMNWYRGLVQTLATDQKMANVLYIDFGNEEDVPVDRIKPLAANIQRVFPCAMECRISRVVPVDGKWSGQCCIAVRELLAGKMVTVKLLETPEHDRIHAVDILLSMGNQLSTYLIEKGYATEEAFDTPPTQQEIHAMLNASFENFKCLSEGKDDNSWAKPPEPLTQAVGDSFSVVVTHLQSPCDIIVQKVGNAGVIQELQLKLREHCCQVSPPQNFRPAPGTVCCAQFSEDKQWYRAKVLAYSSAERVCVGYLDFGNSEETDIGSLKPISSSLLALPMQAIPCGLAGVQPVGESWPQDCIVALQRRVCNRLLHINIKGAHEGKALVVMIDEASDPQADVAELLIFAGFAAPAAVPTSSDQQADQTTTAAAEPHVPAPPCEPLVWSFTELPCDGQTVALQASVAENPQDFYCRQAVNDPKDQQRLIELGAALKQHCEANAASPFVPKVGEPCCALFPDDGEWYRAMVNELSEDKVSVNLVDYGYSMKVEKKHLQSITPRLLTLPFQAMHCRLAGVEPLGSEWSSEAVMWFQALVDGEQLSACVLSVSGQGYDVKLESRGQDVAAALISEQLAKAPGAIPKETPAITGTEANHGEKRKENEHGQIHVQASNQTSSKETPKAEIATPSAAFPVDWKTVALPVNETFQPLIAAVLSPSLFYLLGPTQVDQQKLQGVMMELAAYCSDNQASLSSSALRRPAPEAACCAQFSGDNNWYRAVVLEVGENELNIIYADYGNTERVPLSRILPIPVHLLQLPFQITRCTLTGKEHFPAEWPEEVLQLFQNLLMKGVLATAQSFDGSANVLSLSLATESGGGDLTAMILDALQAKNKTNPPPSTDQKAEQTKSSTSAASSTVEPVCLLPKSTPETQKGLENTAATAGQTTTPELAPWTPQQMNTPAVSISDPVQKIVKQMEPLCTLNAKTVDPPTCGCSCLSLKNQIDHLEQLLQLQLSLLKQLVGQRQ